MGEKEVRADAVIDVGILAVGLSKNPVTDYCLEVIEDAVRGRIRVLIPYTVVFVAHYILTRFYGVAPKQANNLLRNLLLSQKSFGMVVSTGTASRNPLRTLRNTIWMLGTGTSAFDGGKSG